MEGETFGTRPVPLAKIPDEIARHAHGRRTLDALAHALDRAGRRTVAELAEAGDAPDEQRLAAETWRRAVEAAPSAFGGELAELRGLAASAPVVRRWAWRWGVELGELGVAESVVVEACAALAALGVELGEVCEACESQRGLAPIGAIERARHHADTIAAAAAAMRETLRRHDQSRTAAKGDTDAAPRAVMLPAAEVARALGLDAATTRAAARGGKVLAEKRDDKWFIDADDAARNWHHRHPDELRELAALAASARGG